MKFLLKSLLITMVTFIVTKYAIFFFNIGHTVNYNIGNYNIKEVLNTKDNNEYNFIIKDENEKISFKINKDYKKAEKIIKKIHYKEIDSYKCFLPIFKNNQILTDIICLKDNTIFFGRDTNKKIQEYFKKYGYSIKKFKDSSSKVTVSNTQTLYKDNLSENDYIAIENYKGLTFFNGKESGVKIFENDVYKKPISIFMDKYYLVADYNSQYTFKNFHVINIINGEKNTIRSYDEISFDSYIQGAVDGYIYLFDKESQKQYKISIADENVEEIGNKDNIKFYNGKWTTITLNDALNGKKFENYSAKVKGYDKVDKIDNNYYLYKKNDNSYYVYRMDSSNKKIKTFLFETTDLNSIIYLKNKIYYRNNNDFCYFNEYGTRKILTDTELEFNNDLSLGVYEK